MVNRGTIVRLKSQTDRRALRAGVRTAVVLARPFRQEGRLVCAIGFYSREDGAWARIIPLANLVEATTPGEENTTRTRADLPRSSLPEYRAWLAMRRRCLDPRDQGAYLYAHRVKICPEWVNSFDQFYEDMGPRPSPRHSLDRIDNDGNYEPGNVRWATPKEQSRNTSRTRFLAAHGQMKPLVEWADELGITPQSLQCRLKRGWPVEDAVSRPAEQHNPLRASLSSKRKRGAEHHLAKLTDAKVHEIRAAHQAGESQVSLAHRFSVARGTIAFIVHNKTWRHLLPKEKR
jgi:hypothetical protein